MTVIAWDGRCMAADKQSTHYGHGTTVTKIHRVPGGIVGFSGNEGHAMALLAWFRDGRDPAKWPKKEAGDKADAMFATAEGVWRYSGEDGPFPALCTDKRLAWGCGRDYALAAMHLGCDARNAVRVASELDVNCGMGIDALYLENIELPAIET